MALDYIGSASQGIRNVDEVSWREQLVLIPFMVVGVGLGLWVLRAVSTALLAKVLGGFVIAYALYQMLPLPSCAARAPPPATAGSSAAWSARCSAPAARSTSST